MKSALVKVKTLASNSSRRLIRAASSCGEVINYVDKLVKMAENFPSTPEIATTAAKITAANVTCTTTEKATLTSAETKLDEAVATIETALEAVQEQLMSKIF